MAYDEKLKALVDKVCGLVESVCLLGGIRKDGAELARNDLAKFMMYLSAADGTVDHDEACTISSLCELNYSPEDVRRFISENNLSSEEFVSTVPVSFACMVKADAGLRENGVGSAANQFLFTFKSVGEALIKANGVVEDSELEAYNKYVSMLEHYRDTNPAA